MGKLPIMYEVKVILPDAESLSQSKKRIVAMDFSTDVSRSEQIEERVQTVYPHNLEYSTRLMRPDEIKKATHRPIEARLTDWIIESALRQAALMDTEKTYSNNGIAA